jgi:RNA recognition motif-containing protein
MPSSDAQDAFQHVNGLEMNGRVLRVDQARDRSPRPPRGGSGDRW